ncbi:hypothetical protein DPEC_G00152350 [Dallia pectoralis]|uniref:Uncharacterized protein n=1 Tax=Dallia pectoralis TaxID=75939 RepID=A0ACC2GK44_DALPE|nr:hypothetical protein DPEC_G00152350 [Dallia pectoralis]
MALAHSTPNPVTDNYHNFPGSSALSDSSFRFDSDSQSNGEIEGRFRKMNAAPDLQAGSASVVLRPVGRSRPMGVDTYTSQFA